MKYLQILAAVGFLFAAGLSFAEDIYPPNERVELFGVVRSETGLDANDKPVPFVYLELPVPITVEENEFSDKKIGIRKIQLVFLSKVNIEYSDLIGKSVKLCGELFYRHSAHHYTEVLLAVSSDKDITIK